MYKYLEKEMTPHFEKWLHVKGYAVKREVQTNEGICDLVGCSFNQDNAKLRKKELRHEHMTNEIQTMIWMTLHSNTKKEEVVYNKLEDVYNKLEDIISRETFEIELAKLIKKGFISEFLDALTIEIDWFPLARSVVSIELKLHDFNGALKQAERYSEYSNFTFVGMPEETCNKLSEEKLNQLREHQIGLLAFNKRSNSVFEWVEAKRKNVSSVAMIVHTRISELFWKDVSQTI